MNNKMLKKLTAILAVATCISMCGVTVFADPTDADIIDGFDDETTVSDTAEDEDEEVDDSDFETLTDTEALIDKMPDVTPVTPEPSPAPVTPVVPTTNSTPGTGNAGVATSVACGAISLVGIAVKRALKK